MFRDDVLFRTAFLIDPKDPNQDGTDQEWEDPGIGGEDGE
jgi:hypothetical protein